MIKFRYEEILKDGNRVDWYGTEVPEELITGAVKEWCNSLKEEIDKLESEDLKGKAKEARKFYLDGLWNNIRNAPYRLNGDFYLIKKKRFESEQKETPTKKKTTKKTRKKTTKSGNKSSKGMSTKNSGIIFGNK